MSSASERTVRALLFGIFALLALILAAIGVYGVLSYALSQRAREFGVRVALGATARDLIGLVLAQSMRIVVIGLTAGLLGAIGLALAMRGLLFGVSPLDLKTFVSASMLLATMAMVASYLPARRAAQVDPMQLLRTE